MSRVLVGVDAGGSTTVAAVERDGAPVVVHTGGAANARVTGIGAAALAIGDAVEAALRGDAPDAIAIGAAGAGRPDVAGGIARAIEARFAPARVCVEEDVWIALRAAIPHGDGAVLVAGTGSIAAAEIAGARARIGGHGYLLGDDGSGYAIGSAAVRALLRALDGRQGFESLFDALLEQLDAKDAADVIARGYAPGGTAAIAACAETVIARADAGERTATKIVQSAALELAELVKALLRKADCASREIPLAFSGGLLATNSMLTFLLETRLSHDAPHLHVGKHGPEPYAGALARARELLES